MSRFSLLLFLLPAIYGVRQGLLLIPIKRQAAVALAGAATVAMVLLWNLTPRWILNWALIWPVWCLLAAALIPNLRNTLYSRQEIDLS